MIKTTREYPIKMAVKKGWIGVILLLNIALTAFLINSYLNSKIEIPTLIYTPKKASPMVVSSLIRQGVPLLPIDSFFLDIEKKDSYSWIRYEKNSSMSRKDFFKSLKEKKREKTRRLVVYSGDSLSDFAKEISKNTGISQSTLKRVYHQFSPYEDGGILSGFYQIPYRATPKSIISFMTEFSEDNFRDLSLKFLGDYNPKIFRKYLIIASIIQKETWRKSEKPLVSAVIYNRLKKNIRLQLDATLNYGKYSHQRVTPWRIRHDKSRFNTYRYKGLPPTPLGSVSISSLEAAFKPAKVDYLYFVRDVTGRHIFASTYGEHLANITRIKVNRAKIRKFKRYLKK